MGIERVGIDLVSDQDTLNPALAQLAGILSQVEANTRKTAEAAEAAGEKSAGATQRMKSGWEQVALGIEASIQLGERAIATFQRFAEAAAEDAEIEDRFVMATGRFGEAAQEAARQFVAMEAAATPFTEDDLSRAMAAAANATIGTTVTMQGLQRDVALAGDIAYRTGGNIEALTLALARVESGLAPPRALAALLPGMSDDFERLSHTAGGAGEMIDLLQQNFGGAASNADPVVQKVSEAREAMEEMNASIGRLMVQAVPLIDLMTDVAGAIKSVADAAESAGTSLGDFVIATIPGGPVYLGIREFIRNLTNATAAETAMAPAVDTTTDALLQQVVALEAIKAAAEGIDPAFQSSGLATHFGFEQLKEKNIELGERDRDRGRRHGGGGASREDPEQEARELAFEKSHQLAENQMALIHRQQAAEIQAYNARGAKLREFTALQIRMANDAAEAKDREADAADRRADAEVKAQNAMLVSAINSAANIAATIGGTLLEGAAYAHFKGFLELAEAAGSFAVLDPWGGAAHLATAYAYFQAADESGKSKGGGSAGGGGGGGGSPAATQPTARQRDQDATYGQAMSGGITMIFNSMSTDYAGTRRAVRELNRYASLNSGDGLDDRILRRAKGRRW